MEVSLPSERCAAAMLHFIARSSECNMRSYRCDGGLVALRSLPIGGAASNSPQAALAKDRCRER